MNAELLINLLIYMVLAYGSLLLMWSDIENVFFRIKLRHRLKALKTKEKKLPGVLNYLEKLINVSFQKDSSKSLFIITELLLFLISYLLSYKNFTQFSSLIISLVSLTMPVLLLATRLEVSRTKASKEGISLVSEIYRQYRINNLNMIEALERTSSVNGSFKQSVNRIKTLIYRIRSSCGTVEVREAINYFAFSYGTLWAKMLGQCIKMSVENGSDVSAALADIASQLKDAYKLEEKRRILNGEASRMTLFLVPLMYICCMLVSVFYLGISPISLLNNQFFNPTAYLMFLLIIFLFLINYLLIYLVINTKIDF